MSIIKGNTAIWEYVIGLEIHAQLKSKTKLFSGALAEFGGSPNSQVSLIDAAMPGMLPVLNQFCVEQAIKTGLSVNGRIAKKSVFDRKNYFYADLPQGYQISQFYHPIVIGGEVNIITEENVPKTIRIHHIHLEQDAGKSIHDQSPTYSFIDLNRAGVALMEIVSEPDMRSPHEAAEYIRKLRAILRAIGTCDGDMEKGSMRVDANVSVRKPGAELGTRCEIKNVNSVRNVMRAIEYEAMRQVELIESGGKVDQETRLFDADSGKTRTMRSKEDAMDYRYFPDPDLLPLIVKEELIDQIRSSLPELPDDKIKRYINHFNLSEYDAKVLVEESEVSEFFEKLVNITKDAKISANWITGELFAYLNNSGIDFASCPITSENLGKLILLIKNNTISGKIAKQVFEIMQTEDSDPTDIIEKHGLKQVSDSVEIEKVIDNVLLENQESVEAYKSGKDKLFGFFVGQIMKKTDGKANPAMVNDILKKKLIS